MSNGQTEVMMQVAPEGIKYYVGICLKCRKFIEKK